MYFLLYGYEQATGTTETTSIIHVLKLQVI